jgi:hypothetical protein
MTAELPLEPENIYKVGIVAVYNPHPVCEMESA